MPPTDIDDARSLRARSRSSAETATLIPLQIYFRRHSSCQMRPGSSAEGAGLTLARRLCKARPRDPDAGRRGTIGMNFKYVGPLALLAALVIGDQIRINRPNHKYRLTARGGDAGRRQIGLRRHGGASRPKLQPRRQDQHQGRCRVRRSRRRQEPGRLAGAYRQIARLDEINYVALRAYKAAGQNVLQPDEPRNGTVPVTGSDPGAGQLCRPRRSRHRTPGAIMTA